MEQQIRTNPGGVQHTLLGLQINTLIKLQKADAWDLVKLKDHQLVYRETKKAE